MERTKLRIEKRRLKWLGGIHKMKDDRFPKQEYEVKPTSKTKIKRPRNRWQRTKKTKNITTFRLIYRSLRLRYILTYIFEQLKYWCEYQQIATLEQRTYDYASKYNDL